MNNRNTQPGFIRAIKKFFLSAFVILSFIAYALHNRSVYTTSSLGQAGPDTGGSIPTQTLPPNANSSPMQAPTSTELAQPPAPTETPLPASGIQAPMPTDTPPASVPNTSAQNGQYKDGAYTGPEVDVRFGLVQVQAVIQNGKISNVQFLEYPNDRRTSRFINSFAVPQLQQEAVQAQSANVNMITGATLTSEGFEESLQAALNQAKGVQ